MGHPDTSGAAAGEEEAPDATPLYVDLDGSLVATDTLWESIWAYLRASPLGAWRVPLWLARGRAGFKAALSGAVGLDASVLPYRSEVVEYVRSERARGRTSVLATAADRRIARAVAEHLGVFDEVLATGDGANLKGAAKLEAIERHRAELGAGDGFEYIGDSSADLPVWRSARRVTAVGPGASLGRRLRQLGGDVRVLPAAPGGLRVWARAARVHQWAKNALIFAPLLLAHDLTNLDRLTAVGITFAAFCGIASATYLLNDLLDIEADRQHPRKRRRPIAAGTLSIPAAMALSSTMLVASFGASLLWLDGACTAMLGVYLVLTLAYSFHLKRLLFVDVLVLAGLYTHRILTGGVAAEAVVSPWLLAFSTFFFLSLALVKRYVELPTLDASGREQLGRRAYEAEDLSMVETMGIASGYISILVMALYVSSDYVRGLYATPELLWLLCPVMLWWITRIWFLARRGQVADDPVLFATTDPPSYVAGAFLGAVLVAAAVL
ncbi:MAG: UbiA family prenyltransferase [Myxococcota bacterium]